MEYPGEILDDLTRPLAIVGDTQRTHSSERLLGREQNDAARARILQDIAAERPAAVIHLGDLVMWGSRESNWLYLDRIMTPLRAAGIPVLPILGNHDYWLRRWRGLRFACERFPPLREQTWYARRWGSLGMLFLDANHSVIGRARWRRQLRWMRRVLAGLERDPNIYMVLLFGHYPAYSNARSDRESPAVREQWVPLIERFPKVRAYVAGHAHCYEHIVRNGKHYIVAGGGGGPRVEVLPPDRERHPAVYAGPSLRPFHYLLLKQETWSFRVIVKGFQRPETRLDVVEEFTL